MTGAVPAVLTMAPSRALPDPLNSPTAQASLHVRSIEACRAHLTERGRRVTFAGTAIYRIVAAETGAVVTVTPLHVPDAIAGFVQMDRFQDCLRRWTFTGRGTATVTFSSGTTGDLLKAWRVSVATGADRLTLVLPLVDSEAR